MSNNQTFKDFPNQSHIELKFNTKDQHGLEREEALQKYRRNINLLTKIFAYDVDQPEQEKQHEICQSEKQNGQFQIKPHLLESMRQSLVQLQNRHKETIEQFKKRNELFKQRINEDTKINNQEEFQQFINELQSEDLLCESHPFLDKKSSFYMQTNLQQPIQISQEQCLELKEQLKDDQCILLS
ncbi:unnamed protein product (macronuclear) [Paramecium tetraurelia]|uniref:Uncharacterized protein n=1 Tax=Paramecium tetraurelia TaxID=5888 RepID=A0CTG6_PARTE|nr:uncharacterized protein GSPATT00010317001 [Paramecium tetraurelia]CAK74083.1 unnamed protein product [Paramecium tetraurelia]|eukprot:XP_001441480.1 hypothetical protein (macronuclear) [Paramecium tetraurelia strain d4-2]